MKQFWNRWMEELEAFLKAHGAAAMQELIIFRSVWNFLMASGIAGFLGCVVGVRMHWLAVILWMSDERDNEIILKDLKWLYETITVQLQAGLHIHQALQESEGLMKNKRLRMALHRLTEQLVSGEDMSAALTSFEHSFNNRYISSFCLILRQMQDSGYAVKLLEDIRLQIEEMEHVQLSRKKETLEMQLQLFQMLLFIGVLALVIQGCIIAAFQNINYL